MPRLVFLAILAPLSLGASDLRGTHLLGDWLAEPPAQFHTRCVTFLNGVLEQADDKPDKVGKVLLSHCGEQRSGLATAPLAKQKRAKCQALGKHLVEQLKASQGKPEPSSFKRLVSSSYHVKRQHDYYAPVSEWCRKVYYLYEKKRMINKNHVSVHELSLEDTSESALPKAEHKDTCKDSYCPQDICPDGKGRRQVGKDCCSCKKAEPEIAVDNFDFGEGKIKTDKNAAVDSLKAQVAEAVSKVSSSLDEAATHEEAIRKRLEKMTTANEQDVKKVAEELQNRLSEVEDSVHDAQKELRKLNREAQLKLKYSEKSAASAGNFNLACVCLSLFSLLF